MDNVKACLGFTQSAIKIMSKDPKTTLKFASTISGVLLIIAGLTGIFTINPLSLVISIYNMFFGVLIVLTEMKNYPVFRTLQRRVDVYFHLLSVPRYKGGFYCFIGILAFFAEDWGLQRVCVLVVSIVGLIHVFSCKQCGAPDEEDTEGGGQRTQELGLVSAGADTSDSSSGWASLMKQVVADSPEVLTAGLSLGSAGAASVVKPAAAASDGEAAAEAANPFASGAPGAPSVSGMHG